MALAFSPDGGTLATTSLDDTGTYILLWDTQTRSVRSRIAIEDTEAAGCACDVRSADAGDDSLRPSSVAPEAHFSPDGRIVAVSGPFLIQGYDVTSGTPRCEIRNGNFSDMTFVVSPDSRRVIAQPSGDLIRSCDVASVSVTRTARPASTRDLP